MNEIMLGFELNSESVFMPDIFFFFFTRDIAWIVTAYPDGSRRTRRTTVSHEDQVLRH